MTKTGLKTNSKKTRIETLVVKAQSQQIRGLKTNSKKTRIETRKQLCHQEFINEFKNQFQENKD